MYDQWPLKARALSSTGSTITEVLEANRQCELHGPKDIAHDQVGTPDFRVVALKAMEDPKAFAV